MLKKAITYRNIDDVEVTEEFYFNLTKAELIKIQVRAGDDMRERLMRIVQAGNGQEIIDTFEQILRDAYGIRNGDKFIKPVGAFEEFQTTEAYSILFIELVTDAKASAAFIEGVMPAGLVQQAQAEIGKNALTGDKPQEELDDRPAWLKEGRNPTKAELINMNPKELAQALRLKAESAGAVEDLVTE